MTAHRAFQFCKQYKRTTEFRRLCEIIRNHLANLNKYRDQRDRPDLSAPESLQLYLDTRFEQLKVATELALWQVCTTQLTIFYLKWIFHSNDAFLPIDMLMNILFVFHAGSISLNRGYSRIDVHGQENSKGILISYLLCQVNRNILDLIQPSISRICLAQAFFTSEKF